MTRTVRARKNLTRDNHGRRSLSPGRFASRLAVLACVWLAFAASAVGQNVQFTQGEIGSGLENGIRIPIASYPGRGAANLPVMLQYSSKVWRVGHLKTVRANVGGFSIPRTVAEAVYAEHSNAGWTTSLDVPRIEWPKQDDLYWYDGKPYHNSITGTYRVANVFIHMPGGSTHELRRQDAVYQNLGYVQQEGDYYAVDGSRLRFDNRVGVTPTLYLPDGSRYEFRETEPKIVFIDRHGNKLEHNTSTGVWTDTLGRTIGRPWPTSPQAGQSYSYTPPGYSEPYIFKWDYLSNVLTPDAQGQVPSLKAISDYYLPLPGQEPTNQGSSNFPQASGLTSLFTSGSPPDADNQEATFTNVVGRGQASGAYFNPVVLTEVVLPSSTEDDVVSYKFTYNIYGEIDKVVYPAGGYDRYTYGAVASLGQTTFPYTQGNRGLHSRQQSADGPGALISTWTYEGGGAYVKVTGPDNTVAETYRHNFFTTNAKNFGYVDARNGRVYDERIKNAAGTLLRRTLTKWTQTAQGEQLNYPSQPPTVTNYTAWRNPRPERSVTLMLDAGGQALAKLVTHEYDTGNTFKKLTTGFDQTLMTESHFATIDLATAQAAVADKQNTTAPYPNSLFPPASSTVTTYQDGQAYRDRYILGLATSVTLRDAADNPVSKTETEYDQQAVIYYNDIPNDLFENPGTSTVRGNPTTVRRYVNLTFNTSLETRAQFDQYGNPVYNWDERAVTPFTETNASVKKEYADTYRHAYLTKTTMTAPDPTGQHGSATPFISSSTYEFVTGLVLTTTDVNAQVVTYDYNDGNGVRDPLNRVRKVTSPDGSWTKTHYNDIPNNFYVHIESQLDTGRNTHAYRFSDGLDRVTRSLTRELGENYIVSETRYDENWRVSQTFNPIRTTIKGTGGDPRYAAYWETNAQPSLGTTNEYDALGRIWKVTLADGSYILTEYEGVYTTVTDQAGKQRRQKTNALGRTIRVDEPDANGHLDPVGTSHKNSPLQPSFYEYDVLGNVVRINQGLTQAGADPEDSNNYVQHRYFKYDALSRLTHEKQAEQAGTLNDPVTGQPFWSRQLTYDEIRDGVSYKGRLSKVEDARHVYTFFHYDQHGRTIRMDYSGGTPSLINRYDQARTDAPPTGVTAVTFKNKGRLTEVETTPATTSDGWTVPETKQLYDYDLMGQTRRQRQSVGTSVYELRYDYNLGGKLISERYPSGRVVSFGYDDAGGLLNAGSGATVYTSGMSYAPFGGLESMTLGNGAVYSMAYDSARLQLSGMTLAQGTNVLQKYEYKYGAVNMTTGVVDVSKNNGQLARIESTVGADKLWQQRFQYDSVGRLASAGEYHGNNFGTQTYLLNYDYDVYGNRYQQASRNQNNPVAQQWVEFTGNQGFNTTTNRLTASTVTYDDAGNITRDERFRMLKLQYDANNRMRRSSNLDDTGVVQNVYDGAGRRVARMAGGQVAQVMVYDTGGTLVAEYGGNVFANGTQYVMTDQQGSPRVTMTSAPVNNQLVLGRQDYLPFGEETPAGLGLRANVPGYAQTTGPRQKYAGMEQDEATGMSHTLWRQFDARSARWTTPDPYGGSLDPSSPQSFNRYTYVNNDPVNHVDPTGLMLSDIGVVQVGSSGEASQLNFLGVHNLKYSVNDEYRDLYDERVEQEQQASQQANQQTQSQQQSGPWVDPTTVGPPPPLPLGTQVPGSIDPLYNCVAYGLGFTDRWLQHAVDGGGGYIIIWNNGNIEKQRAERRPQGTYNVFTGMPIPPETVDAFGLFTKFFDGEKTSPTKALKKGNYRVVVFSDQTNLKTIEGSTHVMRQDADGTWSSKNGDKALYTGIADPIAFYNSHYNQGGKWKDLKIRYYEMPGKLLKGK